jgi:hypothetical protein
MAHCAGRAFQHAAEGQRITGYHRAGGFADIPFPRAKEIRWGHWARWALGLAGLAILLHLTRYEHQYDARRNLVIRIDRWTGACKYITPWNRPYP